MMTRTIASGLVRASSKRAVVSAGVIALALGAGCADAPSGSSETTGSVAAAVSTVSNLTGSGTFAQTSINGSGFLEVYDTKSGGNETLTLYYYLDSCGCNDGACSSFTCNGQIGYGTLPPSDFTSNPKTLVLNANTATSTFSTSGWSYTCDTTTWTCNYTNVQVAGGPISYTWTKTSDYARHHAGTDSINWCNYTYTSNGTYDFVSANTTGSILGQSFSNFGDSFGTFKSATVSMTKSSDTSTCATGGGGGGVAD